MGKVLCNESESASNWVAITQDASASAYQIRSYLLLNQKLGVITNLLPSSVYMCVREELKEFLFKSQNIDAENHSLIESGLTRKLVKSLFMPLVYGKTVISMSKDIYSAHIQVCS